jgi:hypothetical protein
MTTSLVIHGHFYQPPRENPWTNYVEREPGAHPFHDWNERILFECYHPNAFARVLDGYGRVERIVNNYAHLSFNVGPTLLSWIETHDPLAYARILQADKDSAARNGGHGNAIAQAYNHAILPLCNERDLRTQVHWGLTDFQFRFGRPAEAMWLPETACNDAVLGALIEEGMKYALLSPFQAERVRPLGGPEWRSVAEGSIDPTVPYKYFHKDRSGRSIALFFYDGTAARSIAFEGALASSQAFLDHFPLSGGDGARIVHVATDGESYGHHTKFGDRTLAYALEIEAPRRGLEVTNYAAYLERHPPALEVEIKAGPDGKGTSWSCAHGVGRWFRDCGCHTGGQAGWNQAWRTPLREALDYLREEGARVFEEEGAEYFRNAWETRDAYIDLVLERWRDKEGFLQKHCGHALPLDEQVAALSLLEMQRNALLMYTSCGWFFNDLSGIETLQVMKYAGRVLEALPETRREAIRRGFLEILAQARSNLPQMGHGADIFHRFVDPVRVSSRRIAAHLGISSLVEGTSDQGFMAGFRFQREDYRKEQRERMTLATARIGLECQATGRHHDYAMAVMYFGGIDFYCVLRPFPGKGRFRASAARLWAQFPSASLPVLLRIAEKEFGPNEYGLEHVLPEGRQHIAEIVFATLVDRFSEEYARLYEDNRHSIEMLHRAGFELPIELRVAAEFTLGRRLEEEVRRQHQSADPEAYQPALEIAELANRQGYQIDRRQASRIFEDMIARAVQLAVADPREDHQAKALTLVQLTRRLGLNPNLERAQEVLFEALSQDGKTITDPLLQLGLALDLSARLFPAEPSPVPQG